MATVSATAAQGAASATLSGTTADLVKIPGYPYLEIVNRDSSVDIWIATDYNIAAPAAGTAGSILVRPGESVVVQNPCWSTFSTTENSALGLVVKGNGNAYACRGLNAGQVGR